MACKMSLVMWTMPWKLPFSTHVDKPTVWGDHLVMLLVSIAVVTFWQISPRATFHRGVWFSLVWYSTLGINVLITGVPFHWRLQFPGGWGSQAMQHSVSRQRNPWNKKKETMEEIHHFLLFLSSKWLFITQSTQALFEKRLHATRRITA